MKITLCFPLASGRSARRVLPAVNVVCPTCGGEGTHVNRAIDGHGLSTEDFEDEGFAEAYFSGAYDVQCSECRGARVVRRVDEDRLNRRERAVFALWERVEADRASQARADAITRRGECGGYC